MNTFKAILFFAVTAFISVSAFAQDVGVLNLRPLHLAVPATWSFDESKRPIAGKGPDGEKVLISVMRLKPGVEANARNSLVATAKDFADGPMIGLTSKNGRIIVRPVSGLSVGDGKIGFSAGSDLKDPVGGKYYFLQYLVAAPKTMIYFTFEGSGEAVDALQRIDSIFATQRWDE